MLTSCMCFILTVPAWCSVDRGPCTTIAKLACPGIGMAFSSLPLPTRTSSPFLLDTRTARLSASRRTPLRPEQQRHYFTCTSSCTSQPTFRPTVCITTAHPTPSPVFVKSSTVPSKHEAHSKVIICVTARGLPLVLTPPPFPAIPTSSSPVLGTRPCFPFVSSLRRKF